MALMTRAMPLQGSLADAPYTVTAAVATDAPVARRDARGAYQEVLDPAGVDLAGLDVPLIDSHRTGTIRATLGRAANFRREGNAIVADLTFSTADDVAPVVQRVRDGTAPHLSIGYSVAEWSESMEGGQRVRRAVRWTISEVSTVSVPADPNARKRTMPKDNETEELTRDELVAQVRSALGLPDTWPADLAEDATPDDIRAAARQALQARQAPRVRVTRDHNATSLDNPLILRSAVTEAMIAQMTGQMPEGGPARELAGYAWPELNREYLRRSGVNVAGQSPEMLTRNLGTSDLPFIAGDALGVAIRRTYDGQAAPIMGVLGSRTVPDFRPQTEALADWTTLAMDKVTESGEFMHSYIDESGETYRLYTVGGITGMSRYAYINGGTALASMSQAQGRRLAADVAERTVAYLEQSSGAGPTMADGNPVFHASRGNIADLDTTSVETVITDVLAARSAMPKRLGKGNVMIGVLPAIWLVPTEFEPTAIRALASV